MKAGRAWPERALRGAKAEGDRESKVGESKERRVKVASVFPSELEQLCLKGGATRRGEVTGSARRPEGGRRRKGIGGLTRRRSSAAKQGRQSSRQSRRPSANCERRKVG